MTFSGLFEKEEALVRAVCEKYGVSCTREDRETIWVGEAVIDLVQLQRALDRTKTPAQQMIVDAWVEKAILYQRDPIPKKHISNVLPHIRPPANRNDGPWGQLIADERLVLSLVYDEKDSLRYIRDFDIPTFAVGLNDLIKRAAANLRITSPNEIEGCVPHPDHPAVWIVSLGDGHDSARILIADQIAGTPVIAWVPHRDMLMISTLSASSLGRTAAALRKECIQRAQLATHPISAEAFLVDGGIITHLPFSGDRLTGTVVQQDK